MGTIIVSKNQLFIEEKGEVKRADELTNNSSLFYFTKEGYKLINKLEVSKTKSNSLYKYSTSHGRLLRVSSNTKVISKLGKASIDLSSVFVGDYRKIHYNLRSLVCTNLPVFGKVDLSNKDLRILCNSILFKQNTVSNQYTYFKQTFPHFLSELSTDSLCAVFSFLQKQKRIKHMNEKSKDFIIMLCSRIGIKIDGRLKGHKSTDKSGSLILTNFTSNSTRQEVLTPLYSIEEEDAIEIKSDVDNILVGSILCQI